jgi:hypothetical protein
MLKRLEYLLNIIGKRGMRKECEHLCHLKKIAQTQQIMFPQPTVNAREVVFHAGRVGDEGFRCSGCGQTYDEDDIHGFYREQSIEDSELVDAPVYTEKYPEEEYDPNVFMPTYSKEIPKLLEEFLLNVRKLINALNTMPPQNLEIELDLEVYGNISPADNSPSYDESTLTTEKIKLTILDISQFKMDYIMSLSRWSGYGYERMINQDAMLYINGVEMTPRDIRILTDKSLDSIKKATNEKVNALYKMHIHDKLDNIISDLEQIADQVRSYESVMPKFLNTIIKNIKSGKGVVDESRLQGDLQVPAFYQAITALQGGRRQTFGRFLFPREGARLSGSDFVEELLGLKIKLGNDIISNMQYEADRFEKILNVINLYLNQLDPNSKNTIINTIRGPASVSFQFEEAERVVKYPICEECAEDLLEKCDDCMEEYLKEDLQYENTSGNPICEGCTESYYGCDECGELIYTEDANSTEHGDIYCNSCFKSVMGVDEDEILGHLEDALRGGVLGLNTPAESSGHTQVGLIPIPASLIGKAIPVLRRLKEDDLKKLSENWKEGGLGLEGVVKKIQSQGLSPNDALVLTWHAQRFMKTHLSMNEVKDLSSHDQKDGPIQYSKVSYSLEQYKRVMDRFLGILQSQVTSTNSFYDTYPLTKRDADGSISTVKRESETGGKSKRLEAIRRFTPVGVDYEVTESRYHDIPSFTIVMSPSPQMIKSSEILFGKDGPDAWDILSQRGTQHHHGAIAYARVSRVEGESYVINNLQRDSDLYNLGKSTLNHYKESSPGIFNALKWWDKKLKFWHVQFLLTLTEFAKSQNEAIYLTPFDAQKRKWSRIPERNKDAYNVVPSEMNAANKASLLEYYTDREEEELEGILEEELFPRLEYYDGQVEQLGSGEDLWRLAHDFERKRKLTKLASIAI